MLRLSSLLEDKNTKQGLFINDIETDLGRKLYIPCYFSLGIADKYNKAATMMDSGSDICIMQATYFYRLFPDHTKEYLTGTLTKTPLALTSYTNHPINILGVSKLNTKFTKEGKPQSINMYIVDTDHYMKSKTPVILSLAILSKFNIDMSFQMIDNISTPSLSIDYDHKKVIPSYFQADYQLSICHGYVHKLLPKQTERVSFVIPPSSPLLPGDFVLITQDKIPYRDQKQIKIFPSTSHIQRVEGENIAYALAENLSKDTYRGIILSTIELCAKRYHLKTVTSRNIRHIKKLNLSLISECRPEYDLLNSNRYITLNKNLKFDNLGVVNSQVYSLDVNFPEHSPDLSNDLAINNDVENLNKSLTEERHNVKETTQILPQEEIEKFYDPKYSVQMGFQPNLAHPTKEDLEPKGISIPESLIETPADVILEKDYDPQIWPYIKYLFLEKYSSVVARHSLDTGSISQSLGFYSVKLKPNVTLPRFKKLYFMDPGSSSMMRDVLEFLLKTDVISKASTAGGDIDEFASPAFLVKRANRNSAARLVVNFKMLNECLSLEPITLSNFDSILNQMRGASLFSSVDIKGAFNSLRLCPESRKLALFSTQWGSFHFNTLPTGLAVSPNALSRFCDKMIHHTPKLDNYGKIEYDENNLPIMISSPLQQVMVYYDDILIYTTMKPTYKESVKYHFELVEKVVQRLHFHKAKLEFSKAQFCKSKINFLGWIIQNDFLQADPKRVEKIRNTPFPKNVPGMRSYLGLLNSLRNNLNFHVLKDIHELAKLTSSKLKHYSATDKQKSVFKETNEQLIKAPLYSKICLPGAQKILLTDSSSSGCSQYSCILAQIVPSKNPKTTVPFYLHLDDASHRLIFDLKIPIRPLPLKLPEQTDQQYLIDLKIEHPPEFLYYDTEHLGYFDQKHNSLGISLQLMLLVHRCVTKYEDICLKVHDYIREHILYHQILSEQYMNDTEQMKSYMKDIKNGILRLDNKLYIIRALSMVLYRTLKVINTTKLYEGKQIIAFNEGKEKPVFFFLLYERDNKYFVRPTMLDTHSTYSLRKHRGSFEVILYHSKTIPDQYKNSKIFDLELFALMGSLAAVKKLVGNDELLVLTDNKCLYYLYHSTVISSSTKIERWGKKIMEDFQNIKLSFINSSSNPADYLSRQYQVTKPQFTRVGLPHYVDSLLLDYVPKDTTFTIEQWKEWVAKNPQYLKVDNSKNTLTNKTNNNVLRLGMKNSTTHKVIHSNQINNINFRNNMNTSKHNDTNDICSGLECVTIKNINPTDTDDVCSDFEPSTVKKINPTLSDCVDVHYSYDNKSTNTDNLSQHYVNLINEKVRLQNILDGMTTSTIFQNLKEPTLQKSILHKSDSTQAIYSTSDSDIEVLDEIHVNKPSITPTYADVVKSPPIPIPPRPTSRPNQLLGHIHAKVKAKLPKKKNKKKQKEALMLKTCNDIGVEGIGTIQRMVKEVKIGQQADLPAAALGSGMSDTYAARNISSVYNPIRSLERIITRDFIISEQQTQYKDIYNQTLKSIDKTYSLKNTTYIIELGLLYIQQQNKNLKVYLTDSLVNKYVAMSHLLSNHQGPKTMIGNLTNYYHPLLQQKCIKFTTMCVACLLCNHPRRTEKLGVFPLDSDVMETLHCDVAESLGVSSKFNHVLVVKCIISNFMILIPMAELKSSEFLHIYANFLHPIFHPKALYMDNGPLFVSRQTIRTIFHMGTQVIFSSAYTGFSHGNAENYVNIAKTIFKKILTVEPNYNWTLLPPLLSQIHNSSKITKSKYSPYEIVFGTNNHLSSSSLNSVKTERIHPALKNEIVDLEKKNKSIKHILKNHTTDIINVRDNRYLILNKNKIKKDLQIGDIVFVKDRSKTLGNTKPLKSYFVNSPFIVVFIKPSTAVIRNILTNLILNRSKNDLKKYILFDSEFNDLPEPVKIICEQDRHEFTEKQIEKLITIDDINFEQFNLEDVELDQQTDALLDDLYNKPPEDKIDPIEVKEQLIQDDDDIYPHVQTRGQIKRRAEERAKLLEQQNNDQKTVTFDLPDNINDLATDKST